MDKLTERAEELMNKIETFTEGQQVPFIVFEAMQERYSDELNAMRTQHSIDMERQSKHWKTACSWIAGALAVLLCGMVGVAIYFLSTYELATYDYSQDTNDGGYSNIVHGSGEIANGIPTFKD